MPSPSATSPSPLAFRPSMRDTLQVGTTTTESEDRQGRCAYPSKPCPNLRAVKLNGDCHNFCEFHRRKANMNQRRWQQRRRRMRGMGDDVSAPHTPLSDAAPSDELVSAQAVMMLQQSGGSHNGEGRYSPVPSHSWQQYSPTGTASAAWAPRQAPVESSPMHHYAPYRPASVNVLHSTLPRASNYTPPPFAGANMIPPLRSLPLPPLLPSVLAPLKSSSPPRNATASVYTC